MKWDLSGPVSDEGSLQLKDSSDETELTDTLLLSSDDSSPQRGKECISVSPPPAFDDPLPPHDNDLADNAMELDAELDKAFAHQEGRVYDKNDDDEWWNEFCVPDPKDPVEVDEEEAAEFEEILNWIDKEFDLEVARNSKLWSFVRLCCLTNHSILTLDSRG